MPNRLCPLKEAARDAPHQMGVFPFTFSELDREADRFVFQLSQLGIKSGERIALFHHPHPSLIAFFFAVWRLGATLCPLNLRLPPSQIPLQLERLKPALFVSSLSQIGPRIQKTTLSSPETSLLLFTSGSTGTPKIAALSWKNLISNAKEVVSFLDLRPGDQWRLTLPLFHVGGIGILFRCFLARASVVLEDSPSITHLSYIPTHLYRSTPVYQNLRCLLLGGAPISSYPSQLPCYLSYGLTEMSSLVAARLHPLIQDGCFFLGHPLNGREMKLSSDGEIYVRGDCLFQGYWEEELSLNEGWFPTGDLGKYCPKEGFAILGRKDFQFISGGENIQPEEIERELLLIPGVLEAVVVGIPDAEFGYRPGAALHSIDPNFNREKMEQALFNKLPKYKIPISLLLLPELPRRGSKIDRKQIFNLFIN